MVVYWVNVADLVFLAVLVSLGIGAAYAIRRAVRNAPPPAPPYTPHPLRRSNEELWGE